MEGLVVLGLLALLIAAIAPSLYALRRRMAGGGQLEFWRMLRHYGVNPAPAGDRALAVAVRRCTLCANVDTCNEWLAKGGKGKLEEFCPNARYVERLEGP